MQKCFKHPSLVRSIITQSFYTNPNYPQPIACKFSAGLKQKFPPEVVKVGLNSYRKEDLTSVKDDYYPIVISIETIYPSSYTGKAKKSVEFTYGSFGLEGGSLTFKYLKQRFLVSKLHNI